MIRLKHILAIKQITMLSCAEFLNISEKSLYNKMAGKTDFTFRQIQKLRELLPEYNVEYLLSDEPPAA